MSVGSAALTIWPRDPFFPRPTRRDAVKTLAATYFQAFPGGSAFSDQTLLFVVRVAVVPVTMVACIVASLYNNTGCG